MIKEPRKLLLAPILCIGDTFHTDKAPPYPTQSQSLADGWLQFDSWREGELSFPIPFRSEHPDSYSPRREQSKP